MYYLFYLNIMRTYLDFEKPVVELENKIEELRLLSKAGNNNLLPEIIKLEEKSYKILSQIYDSLSPWQKVQIARHPLRPRFSHYIQALFSDYLPLSGDRCFGDDQALIGGLATFDGQSVVVMGHEKGTDLDSRIKHNFGMSRPEGYRKAQRLMDVAHRFNLPIITFVDTPGAYPGVDAEERGQAEAIAKTIEKSLDVCVPIISILIGEGGSGGAIAIATANTVLMLEHSVYSVISPEGCASILWRSASKAPDAAQTLRLTAQDLLKLGVIDGIIKEPIGGAHRSCEYVFASLKQSIQTHLKNYHIFNAKEIKQHRREKFLKIGELSV